MNMQRIVRQAALAGAVVASAVAAAPAQAQTTNIDFRTTNGGFTSQSIVGSQNPWTYVPGTGWTAPGTNAVSQQRLLSPVLTATGGLFSVTATHFFDFEASSPTACFDGGNVKASINGGAFQVLAPTAGRGYTGPISANFGNPMAGQQAFCGQSGGFVTSTFSAMLTAGTTVRLALDGGWDDSFQNPSPNWIIQQVSITLGTPQQVVPEPSTYVLMATGLGALGMMARRRNQKA
jgi:hypothetical protein